MLSKFTIAFLALCLLVSLQPVAAHAHVSIQDTTKQTSAIFHVLPDDDPVAGLSTKLFFTIQNQTLANNSYSYSLTITSAAGQENIVPVVANKASVNAEYIFSSQGVYAITLQAVPAISQPQLPTIQFEYAQRVTRGVGEGASALAPSAPSWAKLSVVSALSGAAVLAIIGYNNRTQIKHYSTLKK